MIKARVSLHEWQTESPARGSVLEGRSFNGDEANRRIAEQLTLQQRLEVLELARGLEIRSSSFVGKISLGEIEVSIHPKISGAPLLHLFRYAYGLRDLHLYEKVSYNTERGSFQDLLIQQLAAEVQELLTRGLHREYRSFSEDLSSPRGRIDFTKYLQTCSKAGTSLPCQHHLRTENTLLNQVLAAGVLLGAALTTDADLRSRMRRLSKVLGLTVSTTSLDASNLKEAWHAIDRRTIAYEPSLKLIELLLGTEGILLSQEQPATVSLRGFLFDMNRFFQTLVSRFLRDHLPQYEVQDEHRLAGMFSYDSKKNPQNRRAPTPRPDFAVLQRGQIKAVLDAKYRDLWERNLPREMLYQLALYALGHTGADRRAAILYPTVNPSAVAQSIIIHEPLTGAAHARVDLRPINLLDLANLLVAQNSKTTQQHRVALAHQLAFGISSDSRKIDSRDCRSHLRLSNSSIAGALAGPPSR